MNTTPIYMYTKQIYTFARRFPYTCLKVASQLFSDAEVGACKERSNGRPAAIRFASQ